MLGAVADDLTGATDLAAELARAGMAVTVSVGLPDATRSPGPPRPETAMVIGLKIRTVPAQDAVAAARRALATLRDLGCDHFYAKYCSTFDSRPEGNIGPVADALAEELDAGPVVFVPTYPANGRTVYHGHLFVGDTLLSETGMRTHPLTPMTDPNLVRVLAAQTDHAVGLCRLESVRAGANAVAADLADAAAHGVSRIVVDAVTDEDLDTIAEAVADQPITTGGAAFGGALARRLTAGTTAPGAFQNAAPSRRMVVCGSASEATRRQVAAAAAEALMLRIDLDKAVADPDAEATRLLEKAFTAPPERLVLVHTAADPAAVLAVQQRFHADTAGHALEQVLAAVAAGAVRRGVSRLVAAGGETSGAVVEALRIGSMAVGPEAAPGVPWMSGQVAGRTVNVLLKSGNFGSDDIFTGAWAVLG